MKKIIVVIALLAMNAASWAASKAITLSVPGMDCATCPITVKKALGQVPEVSAMEVNFEKREAVVTYDDSKTNVAALTHATEQAG